MGRTGGTADSLTVEQFASCAGPCTDLEGAGRTLLLLLGLSAAAMAATWVVALVCVGTHLHRLHACLPRWQWCVDQDSFLGPISPVSAL